MSSYANALGYRLSRGPLMRVELAGPLDMVGTLVIIGRARFEIMAMDLLDHPAPWRQGETVTYHLKPETTK